MGPLRWKSSFRTDNCSATARGRCSQRGTASDAPLNKKRHDEMSPWRSIRFGLLVARPMRQIWFVHFGRVIRHI